MSQQSVSDALNSDATFVAIEAPAGCGKTYQGVKYASAKKGKLDEGRLLILTHTHAASDVFASRIVGNSTRVDIRTIDSLILQIAGSYHLALGLPLDVNSWARDRKNGYSLVAEKVSQLLPKAAMIGRALVRRYPVVLCDEHQDANAFQHAVVMAMHEAGAKVRVFADPMQKIYGDREAKKIVVDDARWESIKSHAVRFDELDEPMRWTGSAEELGTWIMAARNTLKTGGKIDLTGTLPNGISVYLADNVAPAYGRYQLNTLQGRPLHRFIEAQTELVILATKTATVSALHAHLGRRIPIWEGHVREATTSLVRQIQKCSGEPQKLVQVVIDFVEEVCTGFSPTRFSKCLTAEVATGCKSVRKLKPATIQGLGKLLINEPDHRGVGKFLAELDRLIRSDPAFAEIKIDYRREFREAIKLAEYEDPSVGFADISMRRSFSRSQLPLRAISTVHKAKGHECKSVIVMPCDREHFPDSPNARRLLYVAISRAQHSLTFVVSPSAPSPLMVT